VDPRQPIDHLDAAVAQVVYAFSGGSSFNVDGTPMIPHSCMDIHGGTYGAPNMD
jgi:hypothetical protein